MSRQLSRLNYEDLAEELLEDGGFTIALDGTRPTSGFVVAVSGRTAEWDLVGLTTAQIAEQLYAFVVDHGAALQTDAYGKRRYLGAWVNDGVLVLDVVQVHPHQHMAILLGRLRGEDAIYDLDTGQTITLRHGVVAPSRPSPEAERDAERDALRDYELEYDAEPWEY